MSFSIAVEGPLKRLWLQGSSTARHVQPPTSEDGESLGSLHSLPYTLPGSVLSIQIRSLASLKSLQYGIREYMLSRPGGSSWSDRLDLADGCTLWGKEDITFGRRPHTDPFFP